MKQIKSERGQSLVELSVSLVVLLILLSGAVEFGMAFFQFVQLQDSAQEGALYGSMNPSDCPGILARVQGASNSPVNLSTDPGVTISVTVIDTASTAEYPCDDPGADNFDCENNALRVDVRYQHQLFMPFLPQMLGITSLPLHAEVTDTILSPFDCT